MISKDTLDKINGRIEAVKCKLENINDGVNSFQGQFQQLTRENDNCKQNNIYEIYAVLTSLENSIDQMPYLIGRLNYCLKRLKEDIKNEKEQ